MAETLPTDLWKQVFGFIPDHLYAARCVCNLWRTILSDGPPKITPRTVLEAESLGWLKTLGVEVNWKSAKANAVLCLAASQGDISGIEFAKLLGATDSVSALASAAAGGQLTAMKRVAQTRPGGLLDALAAAAETGQLEAMKLLHQWLAGTPKRYGSPLKAAAKNGQSRAITLLGELYYFWDVEELHGALVAAAEFGEPAAMEALHGLVEPDNWPSRTKAFDSTIEVCLLNLSDHEGENEKRITIIELLRKWGATIANYDILASPLTYALWEGLTRPKAKAFKKALRPDEIHSVLAHTTQVQEAEVSVWLDEKE